MLYPQGRLQEIYNTTGVTGEKFGLMDRVADATGAYTILTGAGCLALAEVPAVDNVRWIAHGIIALEPLRLLRRQIQGRAARPIML